MLFKDTIKLKEFAELTAAVNFASLKPTIHHVEQVHLKPILGAELYNLLNDAYTAASDESSLTTVQKNLLQACRRVIGPYIAYYGSAKGELKWDDGGLRRVETATNKTAFQYQVTNWRRAQLQEAEQQGELLLEFLEENRADLPLWTSSASFQQYRSLFIKTGKQFNDYFPSHSPYRNYWAMRSKMVQVEQLYIQKAIGADLYNALKAKDATTAPSFTEKETELLHRLRFAIAHFTVAFSIPFLTVRIDANGITVSETGSSTSNDEQSKQKSAAEPQLSLLITSAKNTAQEWLEHAIAWLQENSADFNNWNKTEEQPPVDATTEITDVNTGLSGSFVL